MENLITSIQNVLTRLYNIAGSIKLNDVIDILIISVCIYGVITLIRDTRAGQVVKGLVILVLLYYIANLAGLEMVGSVLTYFFEFAIVALLVVFQPEIRKALEQIGQSKFGAALTSFFTPNDEDDYNNKVTVAVNAVVEAVVSLQQLKMGALIIFERKTTLSEIADTGTYIDAEPSGMLIGNVFFNKAPLHDGAMIIRDGKVMSAGCILPLTKSTSVSASLGTRHRAAIGMSEESDAIIVVVSEETAQISIAENGKLSRNYTKETLRAALLDSLIDKTQEGQENSFSNLAIVKKIKKRKSK